MCNFDEIIDRTGTGCVKYDGMGSVFGRTDLKPLWVADMDWATPDFIVEAIRRRLEHPIFGYSVIPDGYFSTISSWVESLFGWKAEPSHIRYIPGIVKGIAFAQRCFLSLSDKVIIQPPVYHPFRIVSEKTGHEVLYNPLVPVYDGDGFVKDYEMDLYGLEACCKDPRSRMLILSNPHNPGGICWSKETLAGVAEICRRHGVLVVSDEIHGEMAFCEHAPFASVSRDAAEISINFLAPSKTFNIAGIVSSYCIIENEDIRNRFFAYLDAGELDSPSIFSIEATMAAYSEKGKQWRNRMMDYLRGNIDFADSYIRNNIPGIRAVRPQASFLVWLDCRKLGLEQRELTGLFTDGAGLALNDGSMFGPQGNGFMRLNAGCPRSVLKESLEKLSKAIN